MKDAWTMAGPGDVTLREVAAEDIAIFFEQQLDSEATVMAAFPPRGREEHFAHWEKVTADATVVLRTIVVDGEVAGNVVCWIQDGHREVGYWLGKEHWGRGIATAAVSLFVEAIPERPLFAWVAEHNRGSIRVLEKVGFSVAANQPEPDTGSTRYVVMELSDG